MSLAEFTANPLAFGRTPDGDAAYKEDAEAAEEVEAGDERGALLRFKFPEAVSLSCAHPGRENDLNGCTLGMRKETDASDDDGEEPLGTKERKQRRTNPPAALCSQQTAKESST